LAATDPDASEEGQDPGVWTITRSGDVTDALAVSFTLDGTATVTSDYTLSSSSPVTIPVGEASVDVTLTPVDDSVFAEFESATMTLLADDTYVINTLNAFSISIADNDNQTPSVIAGDDVTVTMTAAAPWTPESITTLAWYDPSDPATITASGGTVSELADKSGNGHTMSQVTDTKQPSTASRTAGATNLNLLGFDGGDYLEDPDFPVPESANISIFMVAQVDSVKSAYNSIFSMDAANDFQFNSNSNTQFDGGIRVAGIGNNTSLSGGPFTGLRCFNTVFDKTNGISAAFVDGINRTGDGVYSTALSSSQRFRLFANRSTNEPATGAMGEAIVIEDCSEQTRQKIEGYLAHKWGLQGLLPSDHPHKASSPGAVGAQVALDGTVADADGQTPTLTWTKVSGSGTVLFGDANAEDTTVTFTEADTYVLRLSADDGFGEVYDEVTITVQPPDSDGDGMSDEDELLAGSNPEDSGSQFRLQGQMAGNGTVTLQIPTSGSSYYRICVRNSLTEGDWIPLAGYENFLGTGGATSIPDVSGEYRFYRVEVRSTPWPSP
jgi:hypothetical protein